MKWRIDNYTKTYEGISGKFDVNLYLPPITPVAVTVSDPNCYGYLFITLRVFYERDDSGSGVHIDTTKFKTTAWPESEWTNFKNKVKALSTFWDSRFWLVLEDDKRYTTDYKNVERFLAISTDYARHPASGGRQILVYPRTISCRFDLQMLDAAAGAHKKIKVGYIVDKNTNSPAGVARYTSRSNDSYYDNGDVIPNADGSNAIAHEIGHAIGLPHIGVVTSFDECLAHAHFWDKEGTNHAKCYQGPLSSDIMGGGFNLDWRDAVPWRYALQEMTGVPMQYYVVQQVPFISYKSEIITEGTPRWIEFYSGPSWWPF